MSTTRDPDVLVQAWLIDGPTTLPASTARAIEVASRTTPQRRRPFWPSWLEPHPMTFPRVLLAVVATAIVLVGGVLLTGPAAPGPVVTAPTPTPTVAASPSSAVDPSPTPAASPTTYTSAQYGYTIEHPPAWRPTPATEAWRSGDIVGKEAYVDQFYAPPTGVGVTFAGIAAQPLPAGTDAATWMTEYAERLEAFDRPCGGPASAWTDVVVAGVPGRRLIAECEPEPSTEVVFVIDGVGYVMTGQSGVIDQMLASFTPG